jgi:hypothetical protein
VKGETFAVHWALVLAVPLAQEQVSATQLPLERWKLPIQDAHRYKPFEVQALFTAALPLVQEQMLSVQEPAAEAE